MNAEPFSRIVNIADIPAHGRCYKLEADAEELGLLAAALQIPVVAALGADLEVRPALGGAFSVRGILTASVVQIDVVSLDPIEQEINETVDLTLMPAGDAPGRRPSGKDRVSVDPVEARDADVIQNGRVDLGAIVREHLALGLDPYPRAHGVDFSGYTEDDPASDPSPFAALAALRSRGE